MVGEAKSVSVYDERMKFYTWLMGPGQDYQWNVLLRGAEAEKMSLFVTCSRAVFQGIESPETLRHAYNHDTKTFQQIYSVFRIRSDRLHVNLPDDQSKRLAIYEELLLNARASGFDVGALDAESVDLWYRSGLYENFYERWHMSIKSLTSPTMSHEREIETIQLISMLENIFLDKERYRRLLKLHSGPGASTQKVLDLFQGLLDFPQLKPDFRGHLIKATHRISKGSCLYPTCYELEGITNMEGPLDGGMSADIHKAKFEQQAVCLKIFRAYKNKNQADLAKQFSKEAILWGQLSHPNILPIYGLFRYENRHCLVSPWMDRGNMTDYLEGRPKGSRIQLAVDVAQGLSYLHEHKIVHGDLKGPNILINQAKRACIADFGLSAVMDSKILAWTSQSSAASEGGTTRWQAPELLIEKSEESKVKNTQASDVYACACVFYEIFTGKLPYEDIIQNWALQQKITSGTRPSPPARSSPSWGEWGLTENIWSLMEKCWAKDPAERPSISDVLAELLKEVQVHNMENVVDDVWSPAHFRERVRKPLDGISWQDLDALLGQNNGESSTISEELTDDEAMDVDEEFEQQIGALFEDRENMTPLPGSDMPLFIPRHYTAPTTTETANKRKLEPVAAEDSLLDSREGLAQQRPYVQRARKVKRRGGKGDGRLTRTWGP